MDFYWEDYLSVYMFMALAFGLFSGFPVAFVVGGIGLAFFVSQIRPTFNDPRTLREITGLPLLGMVSMTWTRQQTSKYRKRLVAFVVSSAGLLGAYATIMAMLFLTAKAV